VKPGSHANIAIERTLISKLPQPYNDCFSKDSDSKMNDLVRGTLQFSEVYTQQYCLQLCFQKFLERVCGCYDNSVPNYRSDEYEACPKFVDSLYNCQYLVKRIFYNGANENDCFQKCPKECQTIKFKTTVSYSSYPTNAYMEKLKEDNKDNRSDNLEFSKKSVLSFNIYYNSDKYMDISEEPDMLWINLIPEVGGNQKLFLK
jgi:hypothetical protein